MLLNCDPDVVVLLIGLPQGGGQLFVAGLIALAAPLINLFGREDVRQRAAFLELEAGVVHVEGADLKQGAVFFGCNHTFLFTLVCSFGRFLLPLQIGEFGRPLVAQEHLVEGGAVEALGGDAAVGVELADLDAVGGLLIPHDQLYNVKLPI